MTKLPLSNVEKHCYLTEKSKLVISAIIVCAPPLNTRDWWLPLDGIWMCIKKSHLIETTYSSVAHYSAVSRFLYACNKQGWVLCLDHAQADHAYKQNVPVL